MPAISSWLPSTAPTEERPPIHDVSKELSQGVQSSVNENTRRCDWIRCRVTDLATCVGKSAIAAGFELVVFVFVPVNRLIMSFQYPGNL